MGFIKVDQTNIDQEHICCAISDKRGETCVSSKKAWMKERFADGLVFQKLDQRGKVFIEYMPAEKAWCPISFRPKVSEIQGISNCRQSRTIF